MKQEIEQRNQNKTKIKFLLQGKKTWEPGKRSRYLEELTRQECTVIFSTRTRMLKVKGNYKGMYNNTTCRICGGKEETQEHIRSVHKPKRK